MSQSRVYETLRRLGGEATAARIRDEHGNTMKSLYQSLRALERRGLVERVPLKGHPSVRYAWRVTGMPIKGVEAVELRRDAWPTESAAVDHVVRAFGIPRTLLVAEEHASAYRFRVLSRDEVGRM